MLDLVVQRRHAAVGSGAEPREQALARVHDEPPHAPRAHAVHKLAQLGVRVSLVCTDATLDRHFGVAHLR